MYMLSYPREPIEPFEVARSAQDFKEFGCKVVAVSVIWGDDDKMEEEEEEEEMVVTEKEGREVRNTRHVKTRCFENALEQY